jgi:hypothetical protein
MTNYAPLIAAWNSTTQPPTGVLGTALATGMTTQQKLNAVNGWVITGSVPTVLSVTGPQVANCINWTEFNALSSTAQINILTLCNSPGPLVGGSANTTFLVDGMILASFTTGSKTIAALTALAQAAVTPWWQQNGFTGPFTTTDLGLAGGLT